MCNGVYFVCCALKLTARICGLPLADICSIFATDVKAGVADTIDSVILRNGNRHDCVSEARGGNAEDSSVN